MSRANIFIYIFKCICLYKYIGNEIYELVVSQKKTFPETTTNKNINVKGKINNRISKYQAYRVVCITDELRYVERPKQFGTKR